MMRIKWHFHNDVTPQFTEIPALATKSKWQLPKGHPNLEDILSRTEKELFELNQTPLGYSNFSKEEWQAMRSLANDRSIVIRKAYKGSCVVVCDRENYGAETKKQLGDRNV